MTTRRTFLATLTAVSLAPTLARAMSKRVGTFTGRSRHTMSGSVEVTETTVVLQEDYKLDRAPDPIVGLGNGEVYDPATYMGELKSLSGTSSYAMPEGIDVADYSEVIIWCRAADVPLGIAPLA